MIRWFKNGDHPGDYKRDHEGLETVDGVQRVRIFTGAERKERDWEGDVVRYYRHPDVAGDTVCARCNNTMHVHGWVDPSRFLLPGDGIVCPGDCVPSVLPEAP